MNIRKITAALSAATLFPFSAGIIPMSANAFSSAPDSDDYAPEWVPDDLESAIGFCNTYGATHYENGYLCIVFPEDIMTGPADSIGKERYSFETEGNAMLEVGRKKITGKMFKDFNVQVYRAWTTGDFEASVIDTWAQPSDPDKGITNEAAHYSFSVDANYNITETDILGWAPDCPAEFSEYVEKNGQLSVKDNCAVFCLTYNSGTPDEWTRTEYDGDCFVLKDVLSANVTEDNIRDGGDVSNVYVYEAVKDGYSKISYGCAPVYSSASPKETITADCVVLDNAQTVLLSEDKRITVKDYESGGLIDVEKNKGFSVNQIVNTPGSAPKLADITSNPCIVRNVEYSLDDTTFLMTPDGFSVPTYPDTALTAEDHKEVTKYDNGAEDIVYKVIAEPTGDVNGDGYLTIADMLLMQKWLLSGSDTELADWRAGDLNKDEVIDAFDLVLMRKAIISKPVAPVSVSITQTGGIMGVHNEWKIYQEDGEYKLSAPAHNGDHNNDVNLIYNITKQDYSSIMSENYARIIEEGANDTGLLVNDGFAYHYVITYANGDTAETTRSFSEVALKLRDLTYKYQEQ